MSRPSIFHADDVHAVLPGAQAALTDLRARGLTHRYVRHVRSSQAFALNLFAPLSEPAILLVFEALGHPDIVEVEPPSFEYEDTADRLQEASPRSRHRTQVDVLLRGTTNSGKRVAALIEVKLGETNFGACSAFSSAENTDRDVCAQPGLFGGNPDRCFQLSNHGQGHRRYADFLEHVHLTAPSPRMDDGGCWVRGGRSQPMRNLAIAHLLTAENEFDHVVYALCAPKGHRAIWRRFVEFQRLFSDTEKVTIRPITAETVVAMHDDDGQEFNHRYAPALNDTALMHLSADGTNLLGLWMHRDGHLTSFYDVDTEAESDYAEAILLGDDWDAILERLPQSSPYLAWWETTDCPITEPIEEAFDRLKAQRLVL